MGERWKAAKPSELSTLDRVTSRLQKGHECLVRTVIEEKLELEEGEIPSGPDEYTWHVYEVWVKRPPKERQPETYHADDPEDEDDERDSGSPDEEEHVVQYWIFYAAFDVEAGKADRDTTIDQECDRDEANQHVVGIYDKIERCDYVVEPEWEVQPGTDEVEKLPGEEEIWEWLGGFPEY